MFPLPTPRRPVSPLAASQSKKKDFSNARIVPTQGTGAPGTETFYPVKHQRSAPVNLYINEDFSVRLHQWFKFTKLLNNNRGGGIVRCEFNPFTRAEMMHFSTGADKLLSIPNAGGSSVLSEVLSFELLHRCFRARLLKVS